MIYVGRPPGDADYRPACPHCGKDYTKSPEQLQEERRIAKAAAKVIRQMRYSKL